MNLQKVVVLAGFYILAAMPAHAVDFICFESHDDCKEKGPFVNVEWIMVVQNAGNGQIALWFDGMPDLQAGVRQINVDWDAFLSHVIRKHGFKQFADYYVRDRYLRRIICLPSSCELRIHPASIWIDGAAAAAVKAYLAEQMEAGRVTVIPSK